MEGPAFFDLVIVGAGFSGLYAAKTFLENDPDVSIRIFDPGSTIGGVWSEENVYPGLHTNNVRGHVDFSDFPMTDEFGVGKGDHVPGAALHEYLKAYAKKWDLTKRISFRSKITSAEKLRKEQYGFWRLNIERRDTGRQFLSTVQARKLVIATGLNSQPHRPSFKNAEGFNGPIMHSAELGQEHSRLFNDPSIETVAVIGAGKSGYDAVHLAACEGKEVEWIIRSSGRGPVWVFPHATNLGLIKTAREISQTLVRRRIVSCFSPFPWADIDGFGWMRNFLLRSRIGQFITKKFWQSLHLTTLKECQYEEDSLRKLEPEQKYVHILGGHRFSNSMSSPFWYGTATGVYSYQPDLYDFIRTGKVRIHRSDISYLDDRAIHLSTEAPIRASAIIAATGYSPATPINFLPQGLHSDLGIPTTSSCYTPSQSRQWTSRYVSADKSIAAQYPYLTYDAHFLHEPTRRTSIPTDALIPTPSQNLDLEQNLTPWHLYRGVASPGLTASGDRSLAFLGMASNVANTYRLELSTLWAYAYLTEQLEDSIPSSAEKIFEDTALLSRFAAYRSPFGHGRLFPDLTFDQLPFCDMYLRDLGVNIWRKGSGRWWCVLWEMFGVLGQKDYVGVGEEWREMRRRKAKSE
ncbi:MAG: hypothetical protein Q9160_008809 [Pyrenula sp. 1 TL-2023]